MIFVPDFYKKFKCIADRCADSCCVGWEIDVDCETLKKYREMGDENILSHIVTDAEIPYIRLSDDERCPFLDGHGLCRIISKIGEDCIPEICKKHPRYYNEILGFTECSIGLSCPTAAEIILSVSQKPKVESIPTKCEDKTENEREIPTDEAKTVKTLYKLRDKLFDFVFDTELDAVGMVSGLIVYQEKISDYLFDGTPIGEIDNGDESALYRVIDLLPRAFSKIELLSEDLRAIGRLATRERIISALSEHDGAVRALLCYFLHRYFLAGAEDFDLDDRLTLSALLLFICLAFIGDGDVVGGCVLFSKNVEYSTENIDILLDIIAEGT